MFIMVFLLIRVKSWLDQPGRHDCELVRNNYLNIIIECVSPHLYYQNLDSEFTGASSTVGLPGRGKSLFPSKIVLQCCRMPSG